MRLMYTILDRPTEQREILSWLIMELLFEQLSSEMIQPCLLVLLIRCQGVGAVWLDHKI